MRRPAKSKKRYQAQALANPGAIWITVKDTDDLEEARRAAAKQAGDRSYPEHPTDALGSVARVVDSAHPILPIHVKEIWGKR